MSLFEKLFIAVPLVTIVFTFVVFSYAIAQAMTHARLETKCLRAGYSNARVTWDFQSYCVKRLDQTDVVVPESEIQ